MIGSHSSLFSQCTMKTNSIIILMLFIIGLYHQLTQGQITITSYPRPLFVELGATFTLSCDYNSYTFHYWVHPTQGEITSSQGRLQFNNIPDIHIATLEVYPATTEDQGVYVCQAVTENNNILNQTITALLFERVQVTTESLLSYQARLCEPVVLNCTALHHDSITWRGQTSHYPTPREIKNSSDGRITVLSETGQLVIHEAKLSDNGTYFCAVSNRVSSKEIVAYLNIERISLELLPHAATIHIDDTAINFTEISFNWDPAIRHRCSNVLYRINATDCGTCPITTNFTTATCSVIRNETVNRDNHSMTCIFAVQTLVHGSIIGHQTILSAIKLSDLTEEFVNIKFNQTASDIQCSFHNQQESFLKSCSVAYGPGEDCRNLSQNRSENSTTNNSVLVHLNIEQDSNDSRIYCFHVTATNDSLTVVTRKVFNVLHSDTNTSLESLPTAVSCNPIDLSDGTLLDLMPSNSTMIMTCGVKSLSLLGIENGIVCYSGSNVGAIAVYSCLSCHFTGSSYETFIRMCTEDGNWTGTTPHCDCTAAGYFIGVSTLSISVGSVLLVLSVMAFTLLLLSVALCRAKAKLQEKKLKASAHLDQDQLYDEVNIHHVHSEDVDTQPNISYATHRKL